MKRVIKKIMGFSVGPIIGYLIGLLLIPITTRLLDPSQFGLSNMFNITYNILTLIILVGLDQAYMRFYNEEDSNKTFFTCVVTSLIVSLIIMILLITFKKELALLLFNNASITTPIIALAFLNPLFILEKFLLLTIRMQEKALQYSVWNIVTKLCNFIITLLFLILYKKTFESIVYATLISQAITSILMIIIYLPQFDFTKFKFDKKIYGKILKFGIPLLFSTLIGWGLNSIDSIFLRFYSDFEQLGYYSLAMKIANAAIIFQTIFTTYWAAIAFKWHANKKHHKYYELVTNLVTYGMACIMILILMCKVLIPIIVGNEYMTSIYIFPFLLFYPIFYTISETITVGIAFSNKTYYNIVVSVISVIVNIILNWIFVPTLGAVGAAIATGLSYFAFFVSRMFISRKLWYKFPIKNLMITSLLLILYALLNTFYNNLIIIFFVGILLILVLTVICISNITNLMKDPNKIKVGIITYDTQKNQITEMFQLPHFEVTRLEEIKGNAFQKLFIFTRNILDKDFIYFGYGMPFFSPKLILCKIFQKKVIMHWIGTDVLNIEKSKFNSINQKMVNMNLVCSPILQKELQNYKIEAQLVPIVPHDMNFALSKVPEEHAALFYLPTDKEEFYGIQYLEILADKFKNINFYVVGNEKKQFKNSNIKNLGKISPAEMEKLYDKISVLVRIPKHDGLSIMLLEALMRGKYVLYCYEFPFAYKAITEEEVLEKFSKIVSEKPSENKGSRDYILKNYNMQKIKEDLYQMLKEAKLVKEIIKND